MHMYHIFLILHCISWISLHSSDCQHSLSICCTSIKILTMLSEFSGDTLKLKRQCADYLSKRRSLWVPLVLSVKLQVEKHLWINILIRCTRKTSIAVQEKKKNSCVCVLCVFTCKYKGKKGGRHLRREKDRELFSTTYNFKTLKWFSIPACPSLPLPWQMLQNWI